MHCQKGKQVKSSFESKNHVSTSRPLELLHMDLFGPTRTAIVSGKRYGLVIVDDYTRWTWVLFITHKDESFKVFHVFYKRIQNESIRSDHGGEFENEQFQDFCEENGIKHNFSTPRTPQQLKLVCQAKGAVFAPFLLVLACTMYVDFILESVGIMISVRVFCSESYSFRYVYLSAEAIVLYWLKVFYL
uniref:Retrovirus-related Pol polyprotein from transposon TNT 1-94 n=1 Tax=Cajanus cajan TaxID=3821 RepID=A0A151SZJ0_CAJCA|nr:Retrovirus-related Pol polyprotein from transposon TNT 1-94 [Cajanus cajan]